MVPLHSFKNGKKKVFATFGSNCDAFDTISLADALPKSCDKLCAFPHAYVGQAPAGEKIEAWDMVEMVGKMKRLIIGTMREAKGEWIRSLTQLGM